MYLITKRLNRAEGGGLKKMTSLQTRFLHEYYQHTVSLSLTHTDEIKGSN